MSTHAKPPNEDARTAGVWAPFARFALRWLAFALLALVMLQPALSGEFISDDFGYIVSNPYVHQLSLENLVALIDPFGEPALYTANWAPLHLLSHALEWALWGPDTRGYHWVNVLLHALASALLVELFCRRGLPQRTSLMLGLFFLVHPANVEAVAWIFQLKTIASLTLATGALLAQPRHPLAGTFLFASALLFKAAAVFALPVALAFAWVARDSRDPWRTTLPWLGAWLAVLFLYTLPQFFAFEHVGMAGIDAVAWVRIRTAVAIAARYLVMAVSSYGTSAFHEPPQAISWIDPWWLAGLALLLAVAARWAVSLRRRSEESAWWMWAAAAYAPVSQIFPFLYPMADRYLYTVLPGLLMAGTLIGRSAARAIAGRSPGLGSLPSGISGARIAAVVGIVVIAFFMVRSHIRAAVWRSDAGVTLDTIRHYPDGISGSMLRAARAGRAGDAEGAARAARHAYERGFDRFMVIEESADFDPVRGDARIRSVVMDMASRWLEHSRRMKRPTQADLRFMARAHIALEQWEEAEKVLEKALLMEGGFTELVRADLARARAQLKVRRKRSSPAVEGEGSAPITSP